MVRRVGLAILFSLLLAGAPVAAQVTDDSLIVPGQRIGKWTLDMPVAQIRQLNGLEVTGGRRPANIEDLLADLRLYWWPAVGLMVATRDERQLLFIAISEFSVYGTDKGISAMKPEA